MARDGQTGEAVGPVLRDCSHRHPNPCGHRHCGECGELLAGDATGVVWLKSALTFAVPFAVSNVGILIATHRQH